MSELRRHLHSSGEAHRTTRYPGDLAGDVLGDFARPAGEARRWGAGAARWIGPLAAIAGVAAVILIGFALLRTGKRSEFAPGPGADGDQLVNVDHPDPDADEMMDGDDSVPSLVTGVVPSWTDLPEGGGFVPEHEPLVAPSSIPSMAMLDYDEAGATVGAEPDDAPTDEPGELDAPVGAR